jgi:hypothetical protein
MHHNSVKIIRLGLTYREIFGLEKVATVVLDNLFVASATLAELVMREPFSTIEDDVQWLKSVDEMMDALQVHFPVVSRMQKTLAWIVQGSTALSNIFGSVGAISERPYTGRECQSIPEGCWRSWEPVPSDFVFDSDLLNLEDFRV